MIRVILTLPLLLLLTESGSQSRLDLVTPTSLACLRLGLLTSASVVFRT
jgi:hypothetical protein